MFPTKKNIVFCQKVVLYQQFVTIPWDVPIKISSQFRQRLRTTAVSLERGAKSAVTPSQFGVRFTVRQSD